MTTVLAGSALAALTLVGAPVGAARAAGEGACPELSTGRQTPPAGTLTVEVIAPTGRLIDQFCTVSPGRPAPDYAFLDPLVRTLVLRTPDGLPIVEYSVSYVLDAEPAQVRPAPATVVPPQAARPPAAVPAGGTAPSDPSAPALLLGAVGILGLGASAGFRRTRG